MQNASQSGCKTRQTDPWSSLASQSRLTSIREIRDSILKDMGDIPEIDL